MSWQTTLYFCSILLTCGLTGLLAWYAWRQPHVTGARSYAYMVLAESLLALTEIGVMLVGTEAQALFWFSLRVPFAAVIPVFWLFFALEYSGRGDWLSKLLRVALFTIPIITQVVMLTSSLHGLWLVQDVAFEKIGLFWIADTSARIPGLWYLVHTFYSTLLLVVGAGVFVVAVWRKPKLLLGQALLVSLGALTALGMALVGVFNLLPELRFNPFVPGIGFSAVCYALAIFRFQFLKRAPAQESGSRLTDLKPEEKGSLAVLILIFILFVSGIAAASYLTYQNYQKHFRAQVESQISAIAALKADELQDWRSERMADASLFYHNDNFSERVQAYLENPQDAETRLKLLAWMEKIKASPEYDRVFLLDLHGLERLSIPAAPEAVPSNLVEQASASLDSNQIIFLDFHRHSDSDGVHLSILVPVFGAQNHQPLGALVLRINPEVYLYPFIQRWPLTSQSAETLLLRREGQEAVYLNALRFQPDAALDLRFPLTETQIPAVKVALGETGVVEGLDYRGVEVIADIRPVPDSPWFLISKMDAAEVYAPLRERLWQTLIFFGAMILASGAGLMLVWRQQRVRFYRAQVTAAEVLRASEEKFRLAFETSSDAITITRLKDGMFISVNKGFEQISGYTQDEVIGRTTLEVNVWKNPEDRAKVVEGLQTNGEVRNYEAPFLKKDGGMVGLISASILELNGIPHILSTIRDITERKQAEEALRESIRLNSSIMRAAQDIIVLKDKNFIYRLVNPAMCNLLGKAESEIIGKTDFDLFPYEPAVKYRNDDKSIIESGQFFICEEEVSSHEGIRYVSTIKAPVLDENNVCQGIVVITRDITERRRAEADLKESERRFRDMMEQVQLASAMLDVQANITFANDFLLGLTGWKREEIIGRNWFDVFAPEQAAVRQDLFRDLSAGVVPVHYENEILTRAGERRLISWNNTVLHDSDGAIAGIAGIGVDITERKQAEEALHTSEANLIALIENTDGSIWAVDQQYGLIVGNREFHRNTSAVLGRNLEMGESVLLPNFPPEVIAQWQGLYDRALQGESFTFETQTHFRELPHYIEYHFSPIREEPAEIRGVTVFGRDITERKQAEDALIQVNDRLALAQRLAGAGVWDWDLATGQLNWSPEFFSLFGLDPAKADATFDTWRGALHPDDIQGAEQRINEAIREHVPLFNEYRIVTPSGETRWIGAWGDTTYNERGDAERMTGICIDITERKQADEKLKESNSDLKQSQSVAHVGNWKWNLKTSTVEWSDEMFRIFGIDKDSYSGRLGDVIAKIIHPDDLHIVLPENASEFANNKPREYRIIRPNDGELRHIWAQAGESILDEQGIPAFLTGIAQDITERKQAEDAMRASEEKFRQAFNISPIAISIARLKGGGFVSVNKSFEQMSGYSEPEVLGKTAEELHLWKSPQVHQGLLKELRDKGEVRDYETPISTRNGEIYCLTSASLIEIKGEPHILTLAVDITERKRAEDERRVALIKYKTLFDCFPLGITVSDGAGNILESNSAAGRLLGVSEEEQARRGIDGAEWKVVRPDGTPMPPDEFASVRALKEKSVIENVVMGIVQADNSITWISVNAAPLPLQGYGVVVTYGDITERRRVEQALHESENKYRILVQNMQVGMVAHRPDTSVLFSNSMASQLLGLSPDQMLGKTAVDPAWHFVQEDGTRMPLDEYPVNRALAANQPVRNLVLGIIHPDRAFPTWVHCDAYQVQDVDGKVQQVIVTFFDITERKHAEDALRKSQTQLQAIMDYSPSLISIKDPNGNIILANQSLSVLEAPPLNEMIGKNVFDIFPREVAQQLWNNDLAALQANAPIQSEEVVKHKDGTWHTYWTIKFPIYLQSDQPFGICAISNDITERKRAEDALRESEAFVTTVLDNLPVGIAVNAVDPAVTFNYMNDNFPKFYRTTREKLADPDIFWNAVYEDADFREAIKKKILDDLASGDAERMVWVDVPITRKGEATTFITARNIPIPGKSLMISTIWDVTERKQAQEQLLNILDELKRSNTELEQFAYIASHDLQEPLRAVAGMVQLLQQRYKGQLDGRADEYIGLAVDGATRMQTLINDLLAYSRVERRGSPIKSTDGNAALHTALRNLGTATLESGAIVTHGDLPTLEADVTQLTQVFQNLIGNAIKFRGQDTPNIHVEARDLGDAWQFSVSDNGIGIEPQYYERIFLVFQRLHTRRDYPGTGIGLSICKKIVERHGGRIWVESTPGQGTTFLFTIPHRR